MLPERASDGVPDSPVRSRSVSTAAPLKSHVLANERCWVFCFSTQRRSFRRYAWSMGSGVTIRLQALSISSASTCRK